MRTLLIAAFCGFVLTTSVYFGAPRQTGKGRLRLVLTDAKTDKTRSGIVRVTERGKADPIALSGLHSRLTGLEKSAPEKGWYVLPARGATITLPTGQYTIEAIAGLETTLARRNLDLRQGNTAAVTLKLHDLFQLPTHELAAGNTHLHLRNMTLPQAGDYIRAIPPADNLNVLFLSYLERHNDDRSYITNRYPIGDLKQFNVTGVLVNNGQEHRHNFKAYDPGYGHVMLLDIKRLVKPVSIGPGIMAKGFDDQPLRVGIDDARKQGGTIIWCHNAFGYEDVLNALTGRLHALNVFDGSRRDTYSHSWYHFLNVGQKIPLSTGTDWFMYDFSRVYARVPGKLTIKNWLTAVKKGRCQATNGPLLSLGVDGKKIGDTLALPKSKTVTVAAKGLGRHDFERLQLVHNGKVVKTTRAAKIADHFAARFSHDIRVTEPGWLALRIETKTKNELGHVLYAHTSPVYIQVDGKDRFDIDSARELVRQLEQGKAAIKAQGTFSEAAARQRVLTMYDDGIANLQKRIAKR